MKPYPEYKDSGVSWLGNIPKHWEVRRSKRVFAPRLERARPDDIQLSATQAFGVISQSEFEKSIGRKVVRITQHLDKRAHVEPDDFVISMRSFQGGLERAWERGCIRSSYVVLKPVTEIFSEFYQFLFKSKRYIKALQSTANFIRDGQDLNFSNFCLVALPVPPIDEQKKIGSFIYAVASQINKFIRNKRRLIALLKEQKQNIINTAVTRGLDPNVRMKPSGVDWLGDIPEHWEVRRLKTIAKVVLGKMLKPSPSKGDFLKPYLRSANIQWFKPSIDDVASMWFSPDELKQYEILMNDILVSEGGEVGRACIWNVEIEECYIQNAVHKVTVNSNILPYFILYQFSAFSSTGFFKAIVNRVSIAHLTREKLISIKFCTPSLREQNIIVEYLTKTTATIDTAISRAEREIELMREYRDRLIADVVTGQVDVRGIEVPEVSDSDLMLNEIYDLPEVDDAEGDDAED